MKKRIIFIVFLTLLIGVGALVYRGQHQQRTAEMYYSGTIEATRADLSFQVAGRVDAVLTDEGRSVTRNQVLARLDPDELIARRDQAASELNYAKEALAAAQAVLSLNRAAIPAEIQRAEAGVAALEYQRDELAAGYRRQEVESARLAYEKARANMADAKKNKDRYDSLYNRGIIAEKDKDTADLKYQNALREFERAGETYALAREGYREETVNTAKAKLAEGQAALVQARSNLKKIEVLEKDVRSAKARLESAAAVLELAEIQLSHTELKAPFDGIVTSRNVEPGEVVSSGREVLSIADLSRVDLKIFVDETEIGKVLPGQAVDIKTDTFPGKTYAGTVSFISPEAEFTPKIIQTHKERVKLVYLVKVAIPNPNLELKPGMPADAWLK